jgi:hypothetical protein
MTPEEKELLKRSIALGEENNSILRAIQRSMRMQRFMSFLYWIFIIGSAVGAFYLVQPYFNSLISVYNSASSNLGGALGNIKNLGQ